ncbi:hypothetical protein ACI01nite_24860 [Acetobacter cibinongensis]|uniref:Uncharacterized protein n=1 Tax=Acetobacter cibinongensis TaxID=146475 RepID=A0A0D6N7Z6_9PROT|nr:hypothetical protein [Acetobacter cibinongensis]GAN61621.1 hypothetical protein Abci_046_054 [Acetobacter cibinongensis]GBQ17554.1 hypothetical protein AA0482_1945 [Acetobacter cibinongensis NRIC 0482]GEL59884.1 hypothetical protein ACI01nite_24860 [Acetobacter cibinongensis]
MDEMGYFTYMAINKEKTVQKLISMPRELAEEISNYRYDNRLPSEAEAVRQLIKLGLEKRKKAIYQ